MADTNNPTPGKSLAELDGSATPPPGFNPGDGNPTPADLEAQRLKDEQEAAAKAEQEAAAAAQRLADLRAKPADQLTAEEKAELEAADATDDDDDGDGNEPGDFWADVNKLRGEDLQIDWKNEAGEEVDPLSPEGALIRERYIESRAVSNFEQHLKNSDPRGYAYILHRQAGGTDEEFFAVKTITLPEYETFKESVDLQQKVYRDDLIRKGVSEKQATMLVEQAVKDKEIFELADKAYKQEVKDAEKAAADLEKRLRARDEEERRAVLALNTQITEEITKSAGMNLIIPDAKRAEFQQFVARHIQAGDGKFYSVQELDQKSLPRILEGLYLQFIGGDLKGLIAKKATTVAATAMTRRLGRERQRPSSQAGAGAGSGKPTLGEI